MSPKKNESGFSFVVNSDFLRIRRVGNGFLISGFPVRRLRHLPSALCKSR